MNKTYSHEAAFKLMCQDLSEDINAELCDEVKAHLKECPECRVYVDTIKQTVVLYRATEEDEASGGVPKDVSKRLFKVLKLDKYVQQD